MWAVLFQPAMANELKAHALRSSHIPGPVLGSISLFIPHPVASTLRESRGEDRRIALEDPIMLTDDVTATDVSDTLSKYNRPHILLVTGTEKATSELTVFGAYLAPKSKGVALQLFFQLRPRFRLLRLSGTQEELVHVINNANEALSPTSVTGLRETVKKDTSFYTGLSAERNRIIIDPVNRLATLTGFPRDCEDLELLKQNGRGSHVMTQRENFEVLFNDITIFRVSGSVPTAMPVVMKSNWTGDPPAGILESTELRIQGEELRSRIMGFGSGSG
jgi:hypothetical protein